MVYAQSQLNLNKTGDFIFLFMRVMGMLCYGEYQIDDCELIVSSGASVGVFPTRTEKHCEYVVIELKKISASN